MDSEVRKIVESAYNDARRLLREHRNQLDALTQALLVRETLDEIDAYAVAGIVRPPKDAETDSILIRVPEIGPEPVDALST